MTDPELAAMGRRTVDLLQEALDEGDVATARRLARRMYGEFSSMHDLYRNWITGLASFIARRDGDEVAAEALRETVQRFTDEIGPIYDGASDRERITFLAAGIRGHLQEVEVREEAGYYEIVAPVCGSGGRLINDGGYEGDDAFHSIEGPSPVTFGRAEIPIYCAHCHFQNQAIPAGQDRPLFETIPAEDLGHMPCRLRVHKTVTDIDA
ncbi:MAG: hypothetical protein GY708_04190 [Actinomycetia bacterium]|nr:hypothetical protein [Actinomycetes bacterium]MCP4962334.1 hypothetical protein [Actinomycetes bacterium]